MKLLTIGWSRQQYHTLVHKYIIHHTCAQIHHTSYSCAQIHQTTVLWFDVFVHNCMCSKKTIGVPVYDDSPMEKVLFQGLPETVVGFRQNEYCRLVAMWRHTTTCKILTSHDIGQSGYIHYQCIPSLSIQKTDIQKYYTALSQDIYTDHGSTFPKKQAMNVFVPEVIYISLTVYTLVPLLITTLLQAMYDK